MSTIKQRVRTRLRAAYNYTQPQELLSTWGHESVLCKIENKTSGPFVILSFFALAGGGGGGECVAVAFVSWCPPLPPNCLSFQFNVILIVLLLD